MNKDQKAVVIDEVADRIQSSQAIFAIDYRGLSVKQAVELRQQLSEAGAGFQVVKNRLTIRAADKAGAEGLKELLVGPTAFTYVQGDPAVAAKAIATFRRHNNLLEFKGGTLEGEVVTVDQIEAIAKLPARDVLNTQFVGILASPITGLVRGLASMIGGLASQLGQIRDQGLVEGEAPADAEGEAEHAEGEPQEEPAEEPAADDAVGEAKQAPAEEAPADAEGEAEHAEGEPQDAEGEPQDAEGEAEQEPTAAEEAATPADDDATAAEAADAEPDDAEGEAEHAEGEAEQETSETSETPSEGENKEPEEG